MPVTNPILLIRADASVRMGTGHVMRCLALAQGWLRTGGQAVFAMASCTPALRTRLEDEGLRVVQLDVAAGTAADAEQTTVLAKQLPAGWIVVDGYHFDADFQRRIKDAGLRFLVVDDYGHATHYTADLVLNQNLHARPEIYDQREPYTRLLLGTRYALLREQFLQWRAWQREIPDVARKVLVTMGGSDPDNATGKIIEALRGLDVEARIIIGGSNPNISQLQTVIRAASPAMELVTETSQMPELMAWADVAVSAGGSTAWELAFMGLPCIIVALVDHQVAVVERIADEGVARNLGPVDSLPIQRLKDAICDVCANATLRADMSRRGRVLVDGAGVERVFAAMARPELDGESRCR